MKLLELEPKLLEARIRSPTLAASEIKPDVVPDTVVSVGANWLATDTTTSM